MVFLREIRNESDPGKMTCYDVSSVFEKIRLASYEKKKTCVTGKDLLHYRRVNDFIAI